MLVAGKQLMVTSAMLAVLKAACANIFDTRYITIKLFVVEGRNEREQQIHGTYVSANQTRRDSTRPGRRTDPHLRAQGVEAGGNEDDGFER